MTPNRAITDFYQFPDLTGTAGLPAPNPNRPKKAWADPQASATDPMTYQAWNGSDTEPALVPLIVLAAHRFANLPGDRPVFPKYVPAPTVASGPPLGLSPATIAPWLATLDQIKAFAALIPGTTYAPALLGEIIYGAETRRVYELTYPSGQKQFAGDLLTAQNSGGIGAPGHWDVSSGVPVWVVDPAPTGAVGSGPAVPFPVSLPAGAKLVSVMAGIVPTVQVQMSDPGPAPTGVDGSFTAADRARAIHIENMLIALLNADRVAIPAS